MNIDIAEKKTKGVTITFINFFFMVLTALVFVFILVISAKVNSRFNAVEKALNKFIVCEQSSTLIKESANYLIDKARLFVITQDDDYVKAYLNEIENSKRQSQALKNLESVCSEKDLALQRLKIALDQGQSLINMELYAMRLIYEINDNANIPPRLAQIKLSNADQKSSPEKLKETAIKNLFGEGYLIYQTRINENCRLTVTAIEQQIKEELNMNADELGINIKKLTSLFLILFLVNIALFIVFTRLIIYPLRRFLVSIQKDERLSPIGSSEFKDLALSYNQIYELKAKKESSLLKKAEYDALTGILNRRAFDQICQVSREKKQPIALLLIDMDNFKFINDNYGHTGGDTALKELARILMETFRNTDYIARIGGDEFSAILPRCDANATNIIKQKILSVNEKLVNIKDGIKPVSVSVGVAFSSNGYTEELYKNADKALYTVKENGKRGCAIFEEGKAV